MNRVVSDNGFMHTREQVLRTLLACVVMACLVGVLFAPVAQALPTGEAYLPVSQVFVNYTSTPNIDETFEYRLTPLDPSNPMPAGSDASGYIFSITGNSTVQMGPIDFPTPGVYTYTLQSASPARPGYTTDPEIYTVKFYITNDQDPLIVVELENGNKAPAVVLDPSYRGSTPVNMVDLSGTKTWNYGTAPQKDRPKSISVVIKNGQKTVKEFKVTAADNWKWSVQLPKYDAKGKLLIYTVDEGNVPHYTHTVNGHNLLNTYKGPNYPGDLPKTGDSIPLLVGVLIVSVALGVLVLFILSRRLSQSES